jgi:Na+-transporting NADH:ubiquinone oxidoreductase subunit C
VDKNSTIYSFGFAAIVTSIVAVSLTFISVGLGPVKAANELVYKQRDILSGVIDNSKELSAEEVETTFESQIEQLIIDHEGNVVDVDGLNALDIELKNEKKKPLEEQNLPLFIAETESGKAYIVPVRGNGLWDAIWGFIAIEDDFSTIKAVAFDHAGETPGLGAEIKDNIAWKDQFKGKQLFDEAGEFVSVDVVKGGAKIPAHQVDGISGATITADGVADMLENDIAKYVAYFNSQKN